MRLDISQRQLEIIRNAEQRLASAERDLRIIMTAIMAGFDTPTNSVVEAIVDNPPSILLKRDEDGAS